MDFVFEWDAVKAKTNRKKHRVAFEEAKTVFNDPWLLTYEDDFHSETEDRFIGIGYSSQERLLLVVYTERGSRNEIVIRLISSRKATAAERSNYENASG